MLDRKQREFEEFMEDRPLDKRETTIEESYMDEDGVLCTRVTTKIEAFPIRRERLELYLEKNHENKEEVR